ncbi:hypothetical protein ACFL0Q_03285, partial [Thermodesulfobacteriota bacterium]
RHGEEAENRIVSVERSVDSIHSALSDNTGRLEELAGSKADQKGVVTLIENVERSSRDAVQAVRESAAAIEKRISDTSALMEQDLSDLRRALTGVQQEMERALQQLARLEKEMAVLDHEKLGLTQLETLLAERQDTRYEEKTRQALDGLQEELRALESRIRTLELQPIQPGATKEPDRLSQPSSPRRSPTEEAGPEPSIEESTTQKGIIEQEILQ